MRKLQFIADNLMAGSEDVLTDGERIISELLWEILQRLDIQKDCCLSDIEVLDRCLRVDVGVAQTLIYQNSTNMFVTLKIYNTDAAQTVSLGKNGVTTVGPSVPLFHEHDMRITVDPGDSIYAIVDLGVVDIRYSVNMTNP